MIKRTSADSEGRIGDGATISPPSGQEPRMESPLKRIRWKKRSHLCKSYFFYVFLSLIIVFFISLIIIFSPSADLLRSFLPSKTLINDRFQSASIQCCLPSLSDERFLWFAPHSGFSNQLSELKNAILFAAILNRTLIVPPILDHHAVSLGSCPKFRVTNPSDLRAAVWDHSMNLIREHRYLSMGDIVDLSLVEHIKVKLIDFRIFLSMWCGFVMDETCLSNSYCALFNTNSTSIYPSSYHSSLPSGLFSNVNKCIRLVEEDCRTTVWTYRQGNDGSLDSFQPDELLLKRKKMPYFVRKHRDLYKAFGSETAPILAFGSLFSSPYKGSELYIDIQEVPGDPRIHSLIKDINFLPFSTEIINAGRKFSRSKIKEPFLCAQLRLLDGQFKNHWKATFSELEQKLQSLKSEHYGLIHIFIMTDLPRRNWSGTYLEKLANDVESYKIYTLHEKHEVIVQTAERLVAAAENGLKAGFLQWNLASVWSNRYCDQAVTLLDVLLYIEETVCSCASLGFVGTAGSTIAESILSMRRNNVC